MKSTLVRRRIVAWALLFTYLPACTSWRVVRPTPSEYLQTQRPGEIRVTLADNSQVKLRAPVLFRDTLVGTVGGGLVQGDTAHQASVPLGDVRTLEVRKFSIVKALGLVHVLGLAVFVFAPDALLR